MDREIKPSLNMWKYWREDITALQVVCAIADVMGGYHISYSSKELLKDLCLYTPKGNLNKDAKDLVATYLHYKYHHQREDEIKIIDPTKGQN